MKCVWRQGKRLEREFANRGFDNANQSLEIYRDPHQSGFRDGLEFQPLTSDVASGKTGVVMVSRMNRISRRLDGMTKFYKFVETHGFRFISAEENVDSSLSHSPRPASVAVGAR